MNVLLTIAPWSHTQTLPKTMAQKSFLNKKFAMTNSLNYPAGLLYICATLRQAGHTPLFVDGYYNTKEQIFGRIEEFKPAWVGVSCIHFSWESTKVFMAEMRQRFPGVKIVIGGYFPSAAKKLCLEECPVVDYSIQSEGEYRAVQLCEALEGKRKMEEVDGLIWRRNGQIVENRLGDVIMDLDALPFPDYDQINFWDYSPAIGSYKALPSAMIFSSRGCKGRCAFCLSNKVVRYRGPDNLVAEITLLRTKYGIRHLQFFDETFTVMRDRAYEILQKMIVSGCRLPWTANARADCVDLELLRAMKQAGCWRVHVGAESGVQKNLDAINKGITVEQIRKAMHMVKRAGMEAYASFIIGLPTETYEEALKTIEFACSLPLDYANFHNLTPAAGAPISQDIEKWGRIVGPRSFHHLTFVPHTMTLEQVADLLVIAYKRFYFRPKYLVRKFFRQRSLEDVRRNLRGFWAYSRLKPEHQLEVVCTHD